MKYDFYLLVFDNGVSKRNQVYSTFKRAREGMKYKYGNQHTKIYGIKIGKKTELNDYGFEKENKDE